MNKIETRSQVTSEVLCRNNADNAVACDLMKRLRALRSDSDYHSELLGTLCLPKNREKIRAGKKEDLDDLFSMIDVWSEGHNHRLASIDGTPKVDSSPAPPGWQVQVFAPNAQGEPAFLNGYSLYHTLNEGGERACEHLNKAVNDVLVCRAAVGKGDSWLAWMVERKHPSGGPQYLTMTEHGSEWVDDPLVGLHFVRREDAERFAAGREDAESITQHEFVDPPWKGQGPAHLGPRGA